MQYLSLTDLSGDRALGPDGFPMAFVQNFWEEVKVEVMCFMTELGVSFLALIPKIAGAEGIKDYRPISLIGKYLQDCC